MTIDPESSTTRFAKTRRPQLSRPRGVNADEFQLVVLSTSWRHGRRALCSSLKLARLSICFRIAVIAALSVILQSCYERPKPLSPCRAQVVKHANSYVSRHIPTSEWQPIIEAEIKKCIAEEKSE